MQRDDQVYLGHILDTAAKIQSKTRGLTRQEYDADENLRLALTHLLQIIGEAARSISQEFKDAHPEVPWKAIVGMRHKVVHEYMYVDEDIVWKTAIEEVPVLAAVLGPLNLS